MRDSLIGMVVFTKFKPGITSGLFGVFVNEIKDVDFSQEVGKV